MTPVTQGRKNIFTFWDTPHLPTDVAAVVQSWKAWAPDYTVRMLNTNTVQCFLPEVDLTAAEEVRLRTDIMRLRLLEKYGGVWLDATVVLTAPLDTIVGKAGFRAVAIPMYQAHGKPDFVESWFLAADAGEPIISTWAETLERVVSENGGVTSGISSTNIYNDWTITPGLLIEQHLPRNGVSPTREGAISWMEYLVVYVTFTYLCQADESFRKRVDSSENRILDATKSGYTLQLKYDWSAAKNAEVLGAPLGSHPDHATLMSGGIIKLSTNDRPTITSLLERETTAGASDTISFFAYSLRLAGNDQTLRRDELELVIAQYDEDITWSDRGYNGTRHVYVKGNPPPAARAHSAYDLYTTLPNVGRECDTYLTHVINQYDSLPSYLAFSQGELAEEHSWIRPDDWGPAMYANMREEAISNGGCSTPLETDPTDITENGADWAWSFNLTYASVYGQKYKTEMSARLSAGNFGQWFHDVAGLREADGGNSLQLYPSALFVVSRDRVLSRPRSYYEQIRKQVQYSSNTIECHYLERSWYYIFGCDESSRGRDTARARSFLDTHGDPELSHDNVTNVGPSPSPSRPDPELSHDNVTNVGPSPSQPAFAPI